MIPDFEVIVIGVGGMGSAACFQLARRGVRVLGLDRFGIPNALGSSHGHSRLIRMAYYEHPDYVPLLKRFVRAVERPAIRSTGGIAHPDGRPLHRPARITSRVRIAPGCQGARSTPSKPCSRGTARPVSTVPADAGIFGDVRENSGVVRPELAVSTFARGAMASGAELHGHEPVLSWSASNSGVEVVTAKSRYMAERLVVCGGPWSSTLCRGLGVSLHVTRQLTMWISPKSMDAYAPACVSNVGARTERRQPVLRIPGIAWNGQD